jgi:membrane protein implicated in regulation of membrane protease activity
LNLSEEAVFKWVVIVAVAAASVIALTLLTRPLFGAIWGLVLICAAAWHGYRWLEREKRGDGRNS